MAQMNLSPGWKFKDWENRLVVARLPRWRGGSGMDWEFGVNRCKLFPLECIRNDV